jgi:K+-transporting ATPase KdpF subunit
MDDNDEILIETGDLFLSFQVTEYESMTFGESVMLLIAIGVLLYLIYALFWPHRF